MAASWLSLRFRTCRKEEWGERESGSWRLCRRVAPGEERSLTGPEQAHRPQPPAPHPAALPQPQPDPHGSISSCQMLTGRGCPRRHPSPDVPPANSPPSGRRGLRLRAPRAGPLSVSSPHPCPASGGARAGAREACGSRPADGKEPRGGSTLPAGFLPSEHAGV